MKYGVPLLLALLFACVTASALQDNTLAKAKYTLRQLDSHPVVPDQVYIDFPTTSDDLAGNLNGAYTSKFCGAHAYMTWQMFQATLDDTFPIAVGYDVSTGALDEVSRVNSPLGTGYANGKISCERNFLVVSRSKLAGAPLPIPRPLQEQLFELAFYAIHEGIIEPNALVVPFADFVTPGKHLYSATAAYNNIVGLEGDYIILSYAETDEPIPDFQTRYLTKLQELAGLFVCPGASPVPLECLQAATIGFGGLAEVWAIFSPTNYITNSVIEVVHVGPQMQFNSTAKFSFPAATIPPTTLDQLAGTPFAALFQFSYVPYTQNVIASIDAATQEMTITASNNVFCIADPLGRESRVVSWKVGLQSGASTQTGFTFMPAFIEDHDVDKVNSVIYTCMHNVRSYQLPNQSARQAINPYQTPAVDKDSEIQAIRLNPDGSHTWIGGIDLNQYCSQIRAAPDGEKVALATSPVLANYVFQLPIQTSPLGSPSRLPGPGSLVLLDIKNDRLDITAIGGELPPLPFALAWNAQSSLIFSAGIPQRKSVTSQFTGITVTTGNDGATLHQVSKNGVALPF